MMERQPTIILPMIALRGLTVFPGTSVSFPVSRQKALDAITAAEENARQIFLVTQRDGGHADPSIEDLFEIGTVAQVKQVLRLPGNITHLIVEGKKRARLDKILPKAMCDYARIMPFEQDLVEDISEYTMATMRIAVEQYEDYLKYVPGANGIDLLSNVIAAERPGQLADLIASSIDFPFAKKQKMLDMINPEERLESMIHAMQLEKRVLYIKKEIEDKTRSKIEANQREYYLREEMKVIQEELGDKDGVGADAQIFRDRLDKKNPPQFVRDVVEKEIDRMLKIPVTSPESNVARTYIETVLSLPWRETTKESLALSEAREILDKDHYGLQKVKERILEYLAVRKNAPEETPTILCLVGPPGVGKTSIAKSVAEALNRKYVRMSLGGVKDEAEIRGHRRTYIGAMPGRIINAMKQVGVINPLMLLDEVDKLGVSHNGDPAAALLEVLDGEQNNTFRDHFVELPYDLSKVLFMCTANNLETIPQPLLDRMEIITLGSYTGQEKFHIAVDHLIPKQRKSHGLTAKQLKIKDDAVEAIIDSYTREAGVRQLERVIGGVCRKAVTAILGGERKTLTVSAKNIEDLLGKKKYSNDEIYDQPQVGIVRGLAWTRVGGTTLSVEVNTMPGEGKFRLTGNLGKVMQESAEAAISYIRSNSQVFAVEENFQKKNDIHIHIPEGATPKDGPSAGVTMATAMISALTGAKVRHDVGMTGEITIRGRVLPIGGLQEKVLAAKKAGVTTVILPEANQKDLDEVNDEIKNGMKFILAETMDDVLHGALAEGESVWR